MWIEHDGKSRPNLPAGTRVKTKHSDGWSDEQLSSPAMGWEWWDDREDIKSFWIDSGGGYSLYITAYQVVPK